jgi:hypothetical protein
MRLYKILDTNDHGPWSFYKWDVSGLWLPDVGTPRHCRNGYHGIRKPRIKQWVGSCLSMYGYDTTLLNLWEIELGGEIVEWEDKAAGSTARAIRKLGTVYSFRPYMSEVNIDLDKIPDLT